MFLQSFCKIAFTSFLSLFSLLSPGPYRFLPSPPSFCQFLFFLLIKEYLRYPSHPSVHCEFLFPLPSSHFSYSFRHHIHKQRSFDMGTGDRQTANDRTNKIAPVLCLSFHALVKVAQIPVHRPIFIFSSRVSSFPLLSPSNVFYHLVYTVIGQVVLRLCT